MIKQLYSALIVRMYYKQTALIPHQVTAKIVAAMNGHEGLRATDMKREAGNKLDYEAFSPTGRFKLKPFKRPNSPPTT